MRSWLPKTFGVAMAAAAMTLLFAAGAQAVSTAAGPRATVIAGSFSTGKAADFASHGSRVAAQRPLVGTP